MLWLTKLASIWYPKEKSLFLSFLIQHITLYIMLSSSCLLLRLPHQCLWKSFDLWCIFNTLIQHIIVPNKYMLNIECCLVNFYWCNCGGRLMFDQVFSQSWWMQRLTYSPNAYLNGNTSSTIDTLFCNLAQGDRGNGNLFCWFTTLPRLHFTCIEWVYLWQ